MSLRLYEIANEYQAAVNELDQNDDINQALEKFSAIERSMEEKAIAVASFIKNLEAEKEAIEEAKKAMALREERIKKKMMSIQDYLQSNMERCGITEIKSSPYFAIKLKKCPPHVDIYNEDMVPDEYRRIKTEVVIDKRKIQNDIRLGVCINGASLKQDVKLEIK
jgi:hypothetical protein